MVELKGFDLLFFADFYDVNTVWLQVTGVVSLTWSWEHKAASKGRFDMWLPGELQEGAQIPVFAGSPASPDKWASLDVAWK